MALDHRNHAAHGIRMIRHYADQLEAAKKDGWNPTSEEAEELDHVAELLEGVHLDSATHPGGQATPATDSGATARDRHRNRGTK